VRREKALRIELRWGELRREIAERLRLDRLGTAADAAKAREIELAGITLFDALGDESVGEVGGVRDRTAVLMDLVEPDPRIADEARRGQEDDRDVGENRADDEPDEAHVVEERKPRDALVEGGILREAVDHEALAVPRQIS